MFRSTIVSAVALGFVASVSHAQFFGTIDFDDGTTGVLTKEVQVSNVQLHQVGDFGGPGLSFNYHGFNPETEGFQSMYLLVDSSGTGAGDVYGDVILNALYRPSFSFEFALAVRVQELVPGGAPGGVGSSGWGLWASQGRGNIRLAHESPTISGGDTKAQANFWDNGDPISPSVNTWYNVTLSVIGSTLTGTVIELDANFLPVPGRSVTLIHTDTDGLMPATGFVGTRGAQSNNDPGYFLDNFTVIPEPGSVALLGLAGLALARRRRRMA